MQCPNCGQACDSLETVCPGCGADLTRTDLEPNETPAEEASTAEDVTAEVPTEAETSEETPEAPTDEPAEDPTEEPPKNKKKRSPLAIILTAIIGLLLIIVVSLTVVITTMTKTGEPPAFITSLQERLERKNYNASANALTVVDENGDTVSELNNAQLSYYYWGEYYYYIQNSGFSFDATKELDEQQYSEDQTWEQFFLENAKKSVQQIEALKAAAKKADFEMPETYQEEYDNAVSSMTDYAASAGFTNEDGSGDILAYIQDSYGPGADEETFLQYLYDSYYVTAYSDELIAAYSFTDEEIEAYYDENAEMFQSYGIEKSDLPNINVRHILIQPESVDTTEESSTVEDSAEEADLEAAAKADAEAEAQRILQEWKDGEATEESFGELANTYSTDGGSNTTGGLYEDVYPGQMVTSFNDWCFDASRKPGDTGIVETDYGYHVMYFVGATENYYWKTTAENELRYSTYDTDANAIIDRYTVEESKKLALITPDAVKTIQQNAASQAAG